MIVKNGLVHPHRLRVIRVAPACLIALFSAAQAEEPNGRHVQIAVVLDASPEPLIAESICEKEVECVVISRPDVGIKVSVVLRQRDDLQANRSTVDCASPCSFPLGIGTVNFRGHQTFDLTDGEASVGRHYLFQRPHTTIGSVSVMTEPTGPSQRPPI
ncbi:hypothetical protein [uncultured Agrobacterium sp.]|uniref:hypothetical protein n=1 Tax=uncultured Agrobacterium sp. TaxID=157277 RepID=UPI0025E31607|nr:hypothetical protein [uncultured Agrobacterium sp.]